TATLKHFALTPARSVLYLPRPSGTELRVPLDALPNFNYWLSFFTNCLSLNKHPTPRFTDHTRLLNTILHLLLGADQISSFCCCVQLHLDW
ncbi:unnamed protein product, partial [Linum tenue]